MSPLSLPAVDHVILGAFHLRRMAAESAPIVRPVGQVLTFPVPGFALRRAVVLAPLSVVSPSALFADGDRVGLPVVDIGRFPAGSGWHTLVHARHEVAILTTAALADFLAKAERTQSAALSVKADARRGRCALSARILRRWLAQEIPGMALSAAFTTFGGGSSIDITWTDGPSPGEVQANSSLFALGSFDGRVDGFTFRGSLFCDLVDGARFVPTRCKVSSVHYFTVAREFRVTAITGREIAGGKGDDPDPG